MTKQTTIASWNVNSIKVRMPQLADWLVANKPDIVALQETKTTNDSFPVNEITELGYSAYFNGQKTYNGVAILCREAVTQQPEINILPMADGQARTITIIHNNTLIVNVYVPNGSTIESEKYLYKTAWLDHLTAYLKEQLTKYKNIVLLGDFNIAPHDKDIHDVEKWQNSVLCSDLIRTKLENIFALGFYDTFRQHQPDSTEFSWWDYRQASFRRDMGLRIDLILASSAMTNICHDSYIDKEPRKNERPSDHTPVLAVFNDI